MNNYVCILKGYFVAEHMDEVLLRGSVYAYFCVAKKYVSSSLRR